MNYDVRCLCLSFMVGTLCIATNAVAADPPAEPAPAQPITKTAEPIKIDGVLDEAVWKNAAVVPVDFVHGKVGQKAESSPMNAKYAWDDKYLYIAYETFDKNLIAEPSGRSEGPKDRPREGVSIWSETGGKPDVVEFFLTQGDPNFFWEIHHSATNGFNDVWITVPDKSWKLSESSQVPYGIVFCHDESLQDDEPGEATFASATALKPKADGKPSTPNDPSDVDTGYTAEIRLPWASINTPRALQTKVEKPDPKNEGKSMHVNGPWKMADQAIEIMAVLQDGDLKNRYHHSSATAPGDWFHKLGPHWPRYILK